MQCVAVNADACLGIVRLRKAAKSQHDRQPEYRGAASVWSDPARVEHLRQQRKEGNFQSACHDFKAAQVLGRRSQIYDLLGEP
jgi:hypothetical protein